ncbi:hypothetical protein BDV10DRAFT_189262 [Aspergillus recurvatus]
MENENSEPFNMSPAVAPATGKPLFTVSVSDIGLQPDQVFGLASKWAAVLLFDEADVF